MAPSRGVYTGNDPTTSGARCPGIDAIASTEYSVEAIDGGAWFAGALFRQMMASRFLN